MRKVIVFNRVSLDGYFTGPNGEIDWFVHDSEVDKTAHARMHPDTVLFGRVTYQMFEGYWPGVGRDPNATKEARALSDELNQMTKVVFSNTLKGVTWENSKLVKNDVPGEVRKLKQGDGPDMVIFGSGTIVHQLAQQGLVDEYMIVVTPVILGAGRALFGSLTKNNLKLLYAKSFGSENVLLHYAWTGK
jgi:dihydrofolate reductase